MSRSSLTYWSNLQMFHRDTDQRIAWMSRLYKRRHYHCTLAHIHWWYDQHSSPTCTHPTTRILLKSDLWSSIQDKLPHRQLLLGPWNRQLYHLDKWGCRSLHVHMYYWGRLGRKAWEVRTRYIQLLHYIPPRMFLYCYLSTSQVGIH